jgi:hypothetical protein
MKSKCKTISTACLTTALKTGIAALNRSCCAALAVFLVASPLSAENDWTLPSEPDLYAGPTNEELQEQADYYNELAEAAEVILEQWYDTAELLESYGEEPFTQDPESGALPADELLEMIESLIEQMEDFQEDCLENADLMESGIDPGYNGGYGTI